MQAFDLNFQHSPYRFQWLFSSLCPQFPFPPLIVRRFTTKIPFWMAREIGFSVHYKPLHHMTYYKESYQLRSEDFPNVERHWRGCVSLPLYPGMTDAELDYIIHEARSLLSPP